MKDRLNAYIQGLFAEAERRSPSNERLTELKEELILNTCEKYDDLLAKDKTPEEAYRAAVDGIGDITELLDAIVGGAAGAKGVSAASTEPSRKEVPGSMGDACGGGGGDHGDRGDRGNCDDRGDRDDRGDGDDRGDRGDGECGDNAAGADHGDGSAERPGRSRWYALVSGIIWTLTLCIYLSVSFATHAWNVTWLLFLMGIAADNVAKCIFDLRR